MNNVDTLNTKSVIALTLHRLGKNEESIKMYKDIHERQKEILGDSHLDTLNTRSHLAMVLINQDQFEESINIYLEVYEHYRDIRRASSQVTL